MSVKDGGGVSIFANVPPPGGVKAALAKGGARSYCANKELMPSRPVPSLGKGGVKEGYGRTG